MGIGTSLGNYYADSGEMAAVTADKAMIQPSAKAQQDDNVQSDAWTQMMRTSQANTPQPISDIQIQGGKYKITDEDINQAMNLGMSFSGGGLSTVGKEIEGVGKAALRTSKGDVIEGNTHGDAFEKYQEKYPDDNTYKGIDQGFVTTNGRFVDREEAFKLATEAKQFIDKGIPPLGSHGLLSEDINPIQQAQAKAGGGDNVSNFRAPANENYAPGNSKRPYNIREPDMIGSDALDAAMDKSWKEMAAKSQDFISRWDALHDFNVNTLSKKDGWNEFNVAKYNKMGREMSKVHGTEWADVPVDPLK
jgi:hypothetical protein